MAEPKPLGSVDIDSVGGLKPSPKVRPNMPPAERAAVVEKSAKFVAKKYHTALKNLAK